MKVAVDVRPLMPPLTGIGRYTYELLQRLVQGEHEWYLYSSVPLSYDFALCSNVTVNVMPFAGSLPGSSSIVSQLIYPVWAKRHDIDVFWSPRHHLPLMLSCDIPSVLTIHDLVWMYVPETMSKRGKLIEKWLMPSSIKKASAIVTVSKSTSDAVVKEFDVETDRLSVITPAPRTNEDLPSRSKLLPLGIHQPYILFVGTVEPRKNLIRLLTAYSQLSDSVKEQAMLVIAGGKGWGDLNINNTIADLGLEKYVRVLGYVDDSTLTTLYANALFLAMPSLYEGFGLPLVEAMVHGTPVLTSNNSSMPEVAGNAGLLVDPLDIQSIQDGLGELIINHDLRKNLAGNAQDNVIRFNWDVAAQQLITVFEKAISARANQHA
jgi:glycosyltransferase involved in cell wall biosynthesis